ncbi:U3 small nucleolar ribonucleoprotein MPP10-like [Babylonia areolata]|uniref:U3 small nucleolar ribonucleoprotein MPP10-like n=1 Tax=Babylonia areolata TaxID=304850 RepID=UPI003FD0871F
MGDLAEQLLAKTAKEYAMILCLNGNQNDAASTLRQQASASLLKGVKEFHDSIHSFDGQGQSEFISELITQGLHEEQVWQQQEVQMGSVKRFLHEQFTVTSLEQLPLQLITQHSGATDFNGQSAKMETAGDDDDDDDDSDDADEDIEGGVESEDSDPELSEIKKRLGDKDGFGELGGSDDDLFDGAEDEWGEEDDENDFDFDLPSEKQEEPKASKPKKRKTEVDDKFFKLADMEEFLDREDRKEERRNRRPEENESDGSDEDEDEDDDDQQLDMFSAWSDEETGKDAVYSDFFDPPADGDAMEQTVASESEEEQSGSEEDAESDEDQTHSTKKKVHFSDNTKAAKEEGSNKQSLSTFEKRTEKLRRQIQALEEESLAEKPWQLMGEVASKDRPENSMLQEHVDFKQAPASAAEMTEERSKSIEDIILQRVKDKAFDDNVRQVRPVEEAFELNTQRTLDQEKSKLSLQEVYEQEYLKLQAPEEEEKTNPVHEEIKKMMNHLFPRLDALASWHYMPLQAVAEVKVKNNVPSVRMEESTPLTMSTATGLAPQEVQAKPRGELKGKGERTKEDKHRERKQKKAAKRQRQREKEQQKKAVEKANPGLGNKYSKERALKELEKASAGNVEVIKEKKGKKSMSSKAFFSQLQDEVTSQTVTNTKKSLKRKSSDKLLL